MVCFSVPSPEVTRVEKEIKMVEIFDRELPDDCKKAITALKIPE